MGVKIDSGGSWTGSPAAPSSPAGSQMWNPEPYTPISPGVASPGGTVPNYNNSTMTSFNPIPAAVYAPASNFVPSQPIGGGGGGGGIGSNGASGSGSTTASITPQQAADQANSQVYFDPTFMSQRQGFNDKLSAFFNQARGEVGPNNVIQDPVSDQAGLDAGNIHNTYHLGFNKPTDTSNPFASLQADPRGAGFDSHFKSSGVLGGTMGNQYNNALAGLDLSRVQGLTNLGEDFAARGLGNSGVYLQKQDLADQNYDKQYNTLNDGVYNQSQDLVNQLAQQAMQTQQNIAAARSDAVGRLTNNIMASMPAFGSVTGG